MTGWVLLIAWALVIIALSFGFGWTMATGRFPWQRR